MSAQFLSTEPYRGVRDFYPDEMAIQQYIFDVWSYTAESFGYQRYDASILEPSELYKAKGAQNEEMVNDQTYTFTDRGDREVTLRPEMTPTVARMIAARRKELAFPVRWYSIPNLFRYERTQRGRLREHWQLNCDIFGATDYSADVELIAVAYQIFRNFGATDEMFEIRVNNRADMRRAYAALGIEDEEMVTQITRLNDRKAKIDDAAYKAALLDIVIDEALATAVQTLVENTDASDNDVVAGLRALGITNVTLDRALARGFDYYTGTIFECFDTDPKNNRSLLGGGRYDNLTALFGGDAISGVGFGFGDVTIKDFLETHNLLPDTANSVAVVVIPTDTASNIEAQQVAQTFRQAGLSVETDISTRKVNKKITAAHDSGALYMIIVGENELAAQSYTVKNLQDGNEQTGTLAELLEYVTA